MTPKKIWGVIIIAVGIFMIFNGASKYHAAVFAQDEIRITERQIQKYSGLLATEAFDVTRYKELCRREKIYGIIGILIGLTMAGGGTLMLRDKKDDILDVLEDETESEEEEREWRF